MFLGVAIVGAILWRSFDPAFILSADSEATQQVVELPKVPGSPTSTDGFTNVDTELTLDTTVDSLALPLYAFQTSDSPTTPRAALPHSFVLPRATAAQLGSMPSSPIRSQYGTWRDTPTPT